MSDWDPRNDDGDRREDDAGRDDVPSDQSVRRARDDQSEGVPGADDARSDVEVPRADDVRTGEDDVAGDHQDPPGRPAEPGQERGDERERGTPDDFVEAARQLDPGADALPSGADPLAGPPPGASLHGPPPDGTAPRDRPPTGDRPVGDGPADRPPSESRDRTPERDLNEQGRADVAPGRDDVDTSRSAQVPPADAPPSPQPDTPSSPQPDVRGFHAPDEDAPAVRPTEERAETAPPSAQEPEPREHDVLRPGGGPAVRRPAQVIALANQKGGVGKTTSVINLGAALAELGNRVLLVDMDPQGSLGVGIGAEPHTLSRTIYNLLMNDGTSADEVILQTAFDNLHVLPSNIDLAAAEIMLVQEVAREQSLRRVLDRLRYRYEFILVDCPPSLGLLTINGLTAADGVIVPLECEYFALRGMTLLMNTIRKVQERLNPELEVKGILATMVDTRTIHAREVLERVHEAFGDVVFRSTINKTIRFAEAPVAGEPILTYAAENRGADAYRELAREVLSRGSTS